MEHDIIKLCFEFTLFSQIRTSSQTSLICRVNAFWNEQSLSENGCCHFDKIAILYHRLVSTQVDRFSVLIVLVCSNVSSRGKICILRTEFFFRQIRHDANLFKASFGSIDRLATQITTITSASSSERIRVCSAHHDQASTNMTSL